MKWKIKSKVLSNGMKINYNIPDRSWSFSNLYKKVKDYVSYIWNIRKILKTRRDCDTYFTEKLRREKRGRTGIIMTEEIKNPDNGETESFQMVFVPDPHTEAGKDFMYETNLKEYNAKL